MLARGDIGNKAVPDDAAIIQPLRAGLAGHPEFAEVGVEHPVFGFPEAQLSGGTGDAGADDGQIVWMHALEDPRVICGGLRWRYAINAAHAVAAIGKGSLAVWRQLILVDHTGQVLAEFVKACQHSLALAFGLGAGQCRADPAAAQAHEFDIDIVEGLARNRKAGEAQGAVVPAVHHHRRAYVGFDAVLLICRVVAELRLPDALQVKHVSLFQHQAAEGLGQRQNVSFVEQIVRIALGHDGVLIAPDLADNADLGAEVFTAELKCLLQSVGHVQVG